MGLSAILCAVLLMVQPRGSGAPLQARPPDCDAVSEWVDYLNGMVERQNALTQREVELTRDTTLTADELANGLAAVAAERQAANAEFAAQPTPASAQPVQAVYAVAWELNAAVADAYLRALRNGDERQRGLADGYTEAGGTVEGRARRMLDALLASCE